MVMAIDFISLLVSSLRFREKWICRTHEPSEHLMIIHIVC